MTGTTHLRPVVSNITLAYLEGTGWYQVDWESVARERSNASLIHDFTFGKVIYSFIFLVFRCFFLGLSCNQNITKNNSFFFLFCWG